MEKMNQDVVWFLYADDMNLLRNTRLVYLMTLIIDKDYLYDIKKGFYDVKPQSNAP